MGQQGKTYKLDIAFVIDATGSMEPLMEDVRARAKMLGDEIVEAMEAAGKHVSQIRARVVDFADYAAEGEDAIHQTPFFDLMTQKAEFEQAINAIDIENRGGDIPENGLEALFIAMNSDWFQIKSDDKGRHIIVVLTDAVPLHLQERKDCEGYPVGRVPDTITDLQDIWDEDSAQGMGTTRLSYNNRRLIVFAPDTTDAAGHTWNDVTSWEWAASIPVNPGMGFKELSLDKVIAEIVRSA